MAKIDASLKADMSVWSGVGIDQHRALLLLTVDDLVKESEPHTMLGFWDSGRGLETQNEEWIAIAAACTEGGELLAVGSEGQVYAGRFGQLVAETPIDVDPPGGEKAGLLRAVTAVGNEALIVGMRRQAYWRTAPNQIEARDRGMGAGWEREGTVVGLEAVSAFSKDDAYAVGRQGEIWHYDKGQWRQEDSPTNLTLTGVLCAPDGYVYACGQSGILLRGRNGRWSEIEHEFRREYLWSLAWFRDTLFATSNHLLLTYDGKVMQPAGFGEDIPFTFRQLGVAGGILWSFGPKDILTFDGANWTRIF